MAHQPRRSVRLQYNAAQDVLVPEAKFQQVAAQDDGAARADPAIQLAPRPNRPRPVFSQQQQQQQQQQQHVAAETEFSPEVEFAAQDSSEDDETVTPDPGQRPDPEALKVTHKRHCKHFDEPEARRRLMYEDEGDVDPGVSIAIEGILERLSDIPKRKRQFVRNILASLLFHSTRLTFNGRGHVFYNGTKLPAANMEYILRSLFDLSNKINKNAKGEVNNQ